MNSAKKKNILIRTDFVIYNTKTMFNEGKTVKVPSYIIQDVIENDKGIMITIEGKYLVTYTTDQLKKNLVTVESKIYKGKFRNEEITYNLCKINIVLDESKIKKTSRKRSNTYPSDERISM